MSELLEEKIDKLIVGGARTTEKGRLDFPDRLPFCTHHFCSARSGCVLGKIYVYLKSNERIGDEGCVAIGICKPIKIRNLDFPDNYLKIDNYGDEYYKTRILPVILKFYDPDFMKKLFDEVRPK